MVEKDAQRIFSKWVQENKKSIATSTVWELKMEKGRSIRFDRVADHQRRALLEAKTDGNYQKINDLPVTFGGDKMRFTNPKPFDCCLIKNAEAYVVVMFYKPRQPKEFLWVEIDRWMSLWSIAEMDGKKSIREEALRENAAHITTP